MLRPSRLNSALTGREASLRMPPTSGGAKVESLSELFSEDEDNLSLFNESGSCVNDSFKEKKGARHAEAQKPRTWQGSCGSFIGDGLLELNSSHSFSSRGDINTGDLLDFIRNTESIKNVESGPLTGVCLPQQKVLKNSPKRRREKVSNKAMANSLLRSESDANLRNRCDDVLFQGNDEYVRSQASPRSPKRSGRKVEGEVLRQPVRQLSHSGTALESCSVDSRPAPPNRTYSPRESTETTEELSTLPSLYDEAERILLCDNIPDCAHFEIHPSLTNPVDTCQQLPNKDVTPRSPIRKTKKKKKKKGKSTKCTKGVSDAETKSSTKNEKWSKDDGGPNISQTDDCTQPTRKRDRKLKRYKSRRSPSSFKTSVLVESNFLFRPPFERDAPPRSPKRAGLVDAEH